MNAPKFARDSPQDHFRNLPPIAGFIAAGMVAFLLGGFPQTHFFSPLQLIRSAIGRVLMVLSASAITIWGLGALQPPIRHHSERRLMVRTTFDALWFAPLALFVCEDSGWAAVITAVLVISVGQAFRSAEDHSRDEAMFAPSFTGGALQLSEAQSSFLPELSALCTALCLQTGATASLVGHPFAGAMLVGIGSAIWTWSSPADARTDERQLRRSVHTWRTLVVLALVILFTAAGLIRYLMPGRRLHGFGIPSAHHSRRGMSQPRPTAQTGAEPASGVKQAYPGVVLWPKEAVATKLVAPMVAGSAPDTSSPNPLIIPFNGVYWFFKSPDLQPPADSRVAHGSPEKFDIRSTDGSWLSMEAHQNLGTAVNLACCSTIQIAIRNADRYPQTVAIELRLIDTTLPQKPSQSLGTMQVHSTRAWKLYDERPPATETLDFRIPPNPLIRRFDEVMVVFRLEARRAQSAAKIGIDRFVLIPRGQ